MEKEKLDTSDEMQSNIVFNDLIAKLDGKKQETRDLRQEDGEAKYQGIIANLTQQLGIVKELKEDIQEI